MVAHIRKLNSAARRKLTQLLIAKSVAETLLVATIAVAYSLTLFPPSFRGWGEATPRTIAGWAVNEAAPWERVEVQLFIDGRFVAHSFANVSRPDVPAAGWAADEWHGYSFAPQSLPAGEHVAHVYALHGTGKRRTLQLVGDPIRFAVDGSGAYRELEREAGKSNRTE